MTACRFLVVALLATALLAADPYEQALAELRQGRTFAAERIMLDHIEAIRRVHGDADARYAKALFQLATVRIAIDDRAGAVQALREAVAVPADDQAERKDQITYEWNLGQILARDGRAAEAIVVLRSNLVRREAFYGRRHAGYAFGQHILAEVLWIAREPAEAATLANEALANLQRNQQAEQWDACAVLGVVQCDLTPRPPPFAALAAADAQAWTQVAGKLEDLLSCRPAAETLPAAIAFRDACLADGAPGRAAAETAQRMVAHLAEGAQRHDLRLQALQWLLAAHPAADAMGVELRMALGNAHGAAGDRKQQSASYAAACTMAESQPGDCLSRTLRNAGLGQRDAGDVDGGLAMLRRALEVARQRQLAEETGRACIALAVSLQHAKHSDGVEALLREGVGLLPLLDPDQVCGYSHLRAAELGLGDCCASTGAYAVERAVQEFIARHIAPDLVAAVTWAPSGLTVRTTRQPTPQEQTLLDRVVVHARSSMVRKH